MAERNIAVTVSPDYYKANNFGGESLGSTLTDMHLQHVINLSENLVSFNGSLETPIFCGLLRRGLIMDYLSEKERTQIQKKPQHQLQILS